MHSVVQALVGQRCRVDFGHPRVAAACVCCCPFPFPSHHVLQGRTIEEIQDLMAKGSVEDPVHAKLLSNY